MTGDTALAAVFHRFLLKLHLAQLTYDPGDTVVLFLARGGIRLRLFYQDFLAGTGLPAPLPFTDCYVSRMSLIKAALLDHYEAVYEDLVREYPGVPVDRVVAQFFGADVHARWQPLADPALRHRPLDLAALQQALWGSDSAADLLRRECKDQAQLFAQYRGELAGDRRRVVVVDTGWAGSILSYLQLLDPAREYTALYFGRHNYGRPTPAWYPQVVGVAVESERIWAGRPETALLAYRHLIESICEIRVPSVTGYRRTGAGTVAPLPGAATAEQVAPQPTEPLAVAIRAHLRAGGDGTDPAAVDRAARRAHRLLWRALMYPSVAQVPAFTVPPRSADFGKDLAVPVVVPPAPAWRRRVKRRRVDVSLWPAGQVALEYPRTRAWRQFRLHHRPVEQRIRAVLGRGGRKVWHGVRRALR